MNHSPLSLSPPPSSVEISISLIDSIISLSLFEFELSLELEKKQPANNHFPARNNNLVSGKSHIGTSLNELQAFNIIINQTNLFVKRRAHSNCYSIMLSRTFSLMMKKKKSSRGFSFTHLSLVSDIFLSSSSSSSIIPISSHFSSSSSVSSLKVIWRKDRLLDEAIENDKVWRLCNRVVKEVLNEPGQVIPLRYLHKRRERLRLSVGIKTFLNQNPGLFDTYLDRIKPKTQPVPFLRVSDRLQRFLDEEKQIKDENEQLLVMKLSKLLMMCRDKVVSADKLVHVKREFGFPNDFLCNLVPKYPEYFRLVGCPGEGKSFLELVNWNPQFAKSVIEERAEEEARLTGIPIRPSFNVKLPPGFFLKKEMREWLRDWMELPYISPYVDASQFDQASPEMEKRTVGVFHELLSLSILKRMPVPILGKFRNEYRFSNAFPNIFTRHSGIFYLSLKGGIKTAILREAYQNEELVYRDPLLVIKDKFIELLAEGHRERAEQLRLRREAVQKEMEDVARDAQLECDEDL